MIMGMSDVAEVEIFYGGYKPPFPQLLGPLPGVRDGGVIAYEMQAPQSFQPWPGRSRLERKYVLLDVGVSLGIPCWARHLRSDGTSWSMPPTERDTWYIDLVTVDAEAESTTYVVRDLFVDVMIACDGRHPRMLDLDELADAVEATWITMHQALDGLRRWQAFLDTYLHSDRFPVADYTDFPPRSISTLAHMPGPFGPPVIWPDP